MAKSGQQNQLKSDSQLEVAIALSDMQLSAVRKEDADVEKRLRAIRDTVWSTEKENSKLDTKKAVFNQALDGLNDKQTRLLCESYARMGELFEVSTLTGRDNYFKDLSSKHEAIPGGTEKFIEEQPDVNTALDKLAVPVFETVMTMHPTNILGLAPMKCLRRISKALHSENQAELEAAVDDYQKTPILHHDDKGHETNLTVRDETKTVLNYLGNVYEDLPDVFKEFDEPLTNKAKKTGETYEPAALHLKARFASWGSAGDKDGNDKVTGEKTLEAMVRHTHDIVERYNKDLGEIVHSSIEQGEEGKPQIIKSRAAGLLLGTKAGLELAEEKLTDLLKKAEKLSDDTDKMRETGNGDSAGFNKQFDEISNALENIRKLLDVNEFKQMLQRAYFYSPEGTEKDKLLEIMRKVRWFGFNFSKIEYRETAEEYEKVVSKLMPGYSDMVPEDRVQKLSSLLNTENGVSGEMRKLMSEAGALLAEGTKKSIAQEKQDNDKIEKGNEQNGRALDDGKDFSSITYHTLKRMELARDHKGMVTDNVLAECGARPEEHPDRGVVVSQGVENLLEAQLLQRLVDKGDKKAMLGIVPLFEDSTTLENAPAIMEGAYTNKVYMKHLHDLADEKYADQIASAPSVYPDGKPKADDTHRPPITQQVQIAHSDNRRRAGSLAGTAYIHEAHNKIRQINNQYHITTQFYEGGSLSDPFRNGVRAISAQVNAFGLHDFAKFTFQGRDMLQYFNHPSSNIRFFTRHFVHQASNMSEGLVHAGDDFLRLRQVPRMHSLSPYGNGADSEHKVDRRPNKIVEEVAIEALKKTIVDYRKDDFTPAAMGTLFAVLGEGYQREAASSNRGSRAAARGPFSGAKTNTHVGAIIEPVGLNKLRTIPFSMVPQQNRLTLSWVGGQDLEKKLRQEITNRLNDLAHPEEVARLIEDASMTDIFTAGAAKRMRDDIEFFKETFKDVPAKGLTPSQMRQLWEKSPAFRDAIDKAAFAIARTDMVAIAEDVGSKLKRNSADDDNMDDIKHNGREYVKNLQSTYGKMASLSYAALTGTSLKARDNQKPRFSRYADRIGAEQSFMMEAMDNIDNPGKAIINGLGTEMAIKNNYLDFIVHAKTRLGNENRLGDNDSLLAVLLAGGLTSTHSRWLGADDPATTKHRQENSRSIGYI